MLSGIRIILEKSNDSLSSILKLRTKSLGRRELGPLEDNPTLDDSYKSLSES